MVESGRSGNNDIGIQHLLEELEGLYVDIVIQYPVTVLVEEVGTLLGDERVVGPVFS